MEQRIVRHALLLALAAAATAGFSYGCGSSSSGTACTNLTPAAPTPAPTATDDILATVVGGGPPGCGGGLVVLPKDQCAELCPPNTIDGGSPVSWCQLDGTMNADGGIPITCGYNLYFDGRRPAGFQPSPRGASGIAESLAQIGELEAASVHAFVQLARELLAYGAPPRLVRAALRAADDEVRHARSLETLTERAGGQVRRPAHVDLPIRALEAIARENMVEGCVRETFGAALAAYRAKHAHDAVVRRAFAPIAREEAGHADLAWELAAWLEGQLDAAARDRIARARTEAIAQLEAEITAVPDAETARQLGLPGVAEARAIFRSLRSSLWETRAAA